MWAWLCDIWRHETEQKMSAKEVFSRPAPPMPNSSHFPTWNADVASGVHLAPAQMKAIGERCRGRGREGARGLSGIAVPQYQPWLLTLAFLI